MAEETRLPEDKRILAGDVANAKEIFKPKRDLRANRDAIENRDNFWTLELANAIRRHAPAVAKIAACLPVGCERMIAELVFDVRDREANSWRPDVERLRNLVGRQDKTILQLRRQLVDLSARAIGRPTPRKMRRLWDDVQQLKPVTQ